MEIDDDARNGFTTELEAFFANAGMESEADVVSVVLVSPPKDGTTIQIAAVPGVAAAGLAPVVVEWFLFLVRAFLEQLRKTALEAGSKSVVERVLGWINDRTGKSKRSLADVDVSDRMKTLAAIVKTLEDAGWPKDAVEHAAEDLWRRGRRAAEGLAKAPSNAPSP